MHAGFRSTACAGHSGGDDFSRLAARLHPIVMDRRYLKKMRAYWAREEAKNLRYLQKTLAKSTWFDLWHVHPDWYGKAARDPSDREAVAHSALRLLDHAQRSLDADAREAQCWAQLHPNTMNDGVYLHSANPNGRANYPHEFTGYIWGATIPVWLEALLDASRFEVGAKDGEDGTIYVVRARARVLDATQQRDDEPAA